MQIFQKQSDSILCGTKEVMELLRVAAGFYKNNKWISKWHELKVAALKDGDRIGKGETVMHITGPYVYFAHLESIYLGILARRTLVATNTKRAVEAAEGKPVIFFADRFDYFLNQQGDGYAAHRGGASGVCTQAHAAWFDGKPVGTLPHALIAVCNGNTVTAAELFSKYYPDVNLITLVDFENDCVRTALEVAKKLGKKLWGVRIDTSQNLIDNGLKSTSSVILGRTPIGSGDDSRIRLMKKDSGRPRQGGVARMTDLSGVNPDLVKLVRKALDQEGFSYVKIVVSGGFNPERIKEFEDEKTPIDVYGVGTALIHGANDFTADIVMVDGKKIAKAGREFKKLSKFVQLD